MDRLFLTLGALSGAIGVAAGAFGAHALRARLEPRMLEVFETGARYQMYHALALVAIALSNRARNSRWLTVASVLFLIGTLCFSGGLYSIVFADQILHWSIVPLGGTTLIAAWLCIAAGALRGSEPATLSSAG